MLTTYKHGHEPYCVEKRIETVIEIHDIIVSRISVCDDFLCGIHIDRCTCKVSMSFDSSMTIIYSENGRKFKIEANNCQNVFSNNFSTTN